MTKRVSVDIDEHELLDDTLVQIISLLLTVRNKYGTELFDIALKAIGDYVPYSYVSSASMAQIRGSSRQPEQEKAIQSQPAKNSKGQEPEAGIVTPYTPVELNLKTEEDLKRLGY